MDYSMGITWVLIEMQKKAYYIKISVLLALPGDFSGILNFRSIALDLFKYSSGWELLTEEGERLMAQLVTTSPSPVSGLWSLVTLLIQM